MRYSPFAFATLLAVGLAAATPARTAGPAAAAAPAATAATAPTAAIAAADRVVLPDNVIPRHYDIAVTPDAAHLRFGGSVRIDVQVVRATRAIVLNAADLSFDRAALSGRSEAPKITLDPTRQTATFTFAQPLTPGLYTLSLDYRGRIYQQASGLFALDYEANGGGQQRALFTQFENSDARRFVPSWDEPGRKATFTLTATVPAAQMAVSNMPVQSSEDAGPGLKRVHFQATPRMSSYLLFFGLGDFERIARRVGKVDVGVVVKRGDAAKAAFALDAAAQLLPYYDEYFGTPYPLPKLDLVAGAGSSQFFGAMENWGAIFYFDRDLLLDPRLSTERDRQGVFEVIAHEMAHQWFGDLVTMAWWDDLWLNEGFASWMSNKATAHFRPQWQVWLGSLNDNDAAMQTDAAQGTHAVVTPIRDVLAASNAFDSITYLKGAAVIRMLESYVGERVFRDGVRHYMKAHAYGNTVSDDLWREIDPLSPRKVTGIAHDFTLQAGVPLISARTRLCTGGQQQLELTQGRFAVDDSGRAGARLWHVPVEIQSLVGHEPPTRVEVSAAAPAIVTVACGPVLVNAGQTGYFRTRYSSEAFAALAGHFAHLTADDQLGLLHDTSALALAGDASLADLRHLAASLPVAADPLVWDALAGKLLDIDEFYRGSPARAAYRVYARELLRPVVAKVGWEARAREPDNVALERAAVLEAMGRLGDPAVVAEARRRFAQLRTAPASVPAAVRKAALQAVAVNADAPTWEAIAALARSAPTLLEKEQYYDLLGSTEDPALAQRALDMSLTNEPPMTLRTRIIGSVARLHPEMAAAFTIAHWQAIAPLLESASAPEFVPNLAAGSTDLKLIDHLDTFAAANIPQTARSALNKSVARIRYGASVAVRLAPFQWGEVTARSRAIRGAAATLAGGLARGEPAHYDGSPPRQPRTAQADAG
ncbi:MAG: ERAP1-like C-terminal domain-containing protein [Proteobacteria bacterium]|nr:ERAP1-like C-terminal domain-containing protein [Pseudomonadota bacterium]